MRPAYAKEAANRVPVTITTVEFCFFLVGVCLGGAGEIFAFRIVAKSAEAGSYLKSKDESVQARRRQVAGRPSQLNQLAALSGTKWVDLELEDS